MVDFIAWVASLKIHDATPTEPVTYKPVDPQYEPGAWSPETAQTVLEGLKGLGEEEPK